MAFHHSPRIVSEGLVFCMDPANTKGYVSGSTSGTDLVQDTSYSLVSAVDYQSNNAGVWNFGGVDDYIDVDPLTIGITGDNPTTMAAWVLNTDTTLRQSVFAYGNTSTNQTRGLEVGTPHSGTRYNMCFHIWGSGYSTTNNAFTENVWHYCVITYAGGGTTSANVKLYIDASDAGFTTQFGSDNQTLATTNNNIRIGMRHGSYTTMDFVGQVGPVQMYNRALTPEEVTQNYNALKGRFE